jgi:hypothetical protein
MAKRILNTKNYRLFISNNGDNRPLDTREHRKLLESMRKHGFLECFPIVVTRNGGDKLVVKDGQHRLQFAESLGLPVYYVEDTSNFEVSHIQGTTKAWAAKDYAMRYAMNGVKSYQEGISFAEIHGFPVSTAFSLLAGTVSFGNVRRDFQNGEFEVKDKEWAETVAGVYKGLLSLSTTLRPTARLLEACMAVCRVSDFDPGRLLAGADKCRDRLVPYSTRESYLDMLEDVYNYNRSRLVGLKAQAVMAIRERSAVKSKGSVN